MCVRASVCACVRACVRVAVHECMCVRVCGGGGVIQSCKNSQYLSSIC